METVYSNDYLESCMAGHIAYLEMLNAGAFDKEDKVTLESIRSKVRHRATREGSRKALEDFRVSGLTEFKFATQSWPKYGFQSYQGLYHMLMRNRGQQ